MIRYRVKRKFIKFKGKMYKVGELLPPTFTEREMYRNIYPSRIEAVEMPEVDEKTSPAPKPVTASITSVTPASQATPGRQVSAGMQARQTPPTGTLSGKGSISKPLSQTK